MSKVSQMPFEKGAGWIRADFHLHTIKEMGASRKKYREEFNGKEECRFVDAFVRKLESKNIHVAAVTNHNSFDLKEYKVLARAARSKNILILPGLELGIRGGNSTIHTLIVFDPKNLSTDNDFINSFLTTQFPLGNPGEGDPTSGEMVDVFNSLEAMAQDYFVIFAHVNSDNGLLNDLKKTYLKPVYDRIRNIWDARVLGFEGVKKNRDWVRDKLPKEMPIPAFTAGSDPRDSIEQVGRSENGTCFLKISDLSFQAVQFALKDFRLRVRDTFPEERKRPVIDRVEIDGGKLERCSTFYSHELNTLIGSRGSGKSLQIEALRWCLGKEPGDGDTGYKKNLVHAFLDKGAVVNVYGKNQYGDSVKITRAYTEKTNPAPPIIEVEGRRSEISVDSVFPGLLYFGQKDLSERPENFTGQLFAQILGAVPQDLQNQEQMALVAYEKAIDHYLTAQKAKKEDDQLLYEQKNLHNELDSIKKHGVEEKLREITLFDQDARRLKKFTVDYMEAAQQFSDASEDMGNFNFEEILFKSNANQEFIPQLKLLQSEHEQQTSVAKKNLLEFNRIQDTLQKIEQQIEVKKQELQQQFATILREINVPELNIDDYRKKVSRFEQLTEIRRLTAQEGGRTSQYEKDMISAGENWLRSRRAITEHFTQKTEEVNGTLSSTLRLGITFQGNKEDFRFFLEDMFRGSRFDSTSYDRLLNACENGLDLFTRRREIVSSELSQRMGEIFEETLNTSLKKILTFSPKDSRTIHFENKSIDELSLGKRAMSLLLLLLSLENHPIILLDQPEDDLDNETIHKLVVEPLVHKKENTQFIIATHNPNIPVLGDAEQVIACYEETRDKFSWQTGSLDYLPTKKAIIAIMEGGQNAFDTRHNIYTLWKNSN